MTFLNWPMLLGLAGMAIPIVIHLLNRRRAAMVDWGAMQFLLASLASRNRRILLEEILLMAVRCLAVGLVAMAMARPLVPSRAHPAWALGAAVLPAVAILGAVGAVMWSRRAVRWAALGGAAALALLAGTATARTDWLARQGWSPAAGGAQDIAIVIDGSMSMTLRAGGQANFRRAVEEARAVVGACRPADTVSLILGGTAAQEVIPTGISDRKELLARLESLEPGGGTMQVLPSLYAAGASVARGQNPGKKIVLIGDGQTVGWDLPTAAGPDGGARNEDRWRWLAHSLSAGATGPPKVICRFLPTPGEWANLAIDDLTFSRSVVGTDRPIRVDVKVANTGTAPVQPCPVELLIDGLSAGQQTTDDLPPGASQTLHFAHRFERPGLRLVTARVAFDDDLPADNSTVRLVEVMRELPVLVVEGSHSPEPLGGAAAFVRVALAPGPDGAASQRVGEPAGPSSSLVVPTVIEAAALGESIDLSAYRMVVLANVPMLPAGPARELAAFVQQGGGLLIVPGDLGGAKDRPQTAFYESWTDPAGRPIAPARLEQRVASLSTPARLADRTFTHPALALVADHVESVLVQAYWLLRVDPKDPSVRAGGDFDSGHPFLAERTLGKGRILLLATSLDGRDNNLPGVRPCFVPLVHELVYYLAASPAASGNFPLGEEVSMALPGRLRELAEAAAGAASILAPSGQRRAAELVQEGGAWRLRFAGADAPGVYRWLPTAPASRGPGPPAEPDGLAFVVCNQPDESRLARLEASDLRKVHPHVDLSLAATPQELTAMVHGGTPGQEIWKALIVSAALAMLAEVGITRWISRQRRSHAAAPVAFGQGIVDIQAFRTRARQLLSAGAAPARKP